MINADLAQTITTGTGAIVCVVDTGVDIDHEDLNGALVNGSENFVVKKGRVDPTQFDDDNGCAYNQ